MQTIAGYSEGERMNSSFYFYFLCGLFGGLCVFLFAGIDFLVVYIFGWLLGTLIGREMQELEK